MFTIITSIILSIIISFTITSIGIIIYLKKANELNNKFIEEYAEKVQGAIRDGIKEHLQAKRKKK